MFSLQPRRYSHCRYSTRRTARVATLAATLLCSWITAVSAATYYIDYSSGSDQNSGTSKSSPWKLCPGMKGFSASYNHVAGDRFIFKGGVTWPNGCFSMNLGGRSGVAGNPDYYGVDQSWFTGSSWSKPHFDAQGRELNDNGYVVMVLNFGNYITFDGIDFTGLYWTGPKQFAWVAYMLPGASTNTTIQNCTFRNWSHGPTSNGTSDSLICIFGYAQPPYNQGSVIQNCDFDGQTQANSTNGQSSGGAVYQWGGRILHCTFKNMINACLIGQGVTSNTPVEVGWCDIGPIRNSFANAHDNGIEENLGASLVHIHDNYIHDCRSVTVLVGGNGGERDFIWNNVFYNNAARDLDLDSRNATTNAYVWNNTFIGDNGHIGVGNSARRTTPFGTLVIQNNHFIGGTDYALTTPGASVNNLIKDHNLVQTTAQATAAGYTAANKWRPTSAGAPTVNAGTIPNVGPGGPVSFLNDILGAARLTGSRDIGAYEFGGTPLPNPTPTATPRPTATPTPSIDPTPVPSAAPSATPSATPASTPAGDPLGLTFDATSGVIASPFVVDSSNSISQTVQTLDPNAGGSATYTFTVDQAGIYAVQAVVSAGSEGSNSLFINIDGTPANPTMIWHVPVTSGFEPKVASWQGSGTYDNPQYVPAVFNLAPGTHQLVVRGRESGTKFQRFSIVRVPSPPSDLRITAGP